MKRKRSSRAREKVEARDIIDDTFSPEDVWENPNPIKRTIKVNQLPWTDKQKDFFKIALHKDTSIIFVEGPAGTSKSLQQIKYK